MITLAQAQSYIGKYVEVYWIDHCDFKETVAGKESPAYCRLSGKCTGVKKDDLFNQPFMVITNEFWDDALNRGTILLCSDIIEVKVLGEIPSQ